MPRRRFFTVAATATAGGLGLWTVRAWGETYRVAVSGRAPGPVREAIMLDKVSVSVFEACVGQTFSARSGDGSAHQLELVEARALEPRPGVSHLGIREDPFSLMFKAPAAAALEQGMYTLEHARLGTMALFMVPVGVRKPSDPIMLQAIFG